MADPSPRPIFASGEGHAAAPIGQPRVTIVIPVFNGSNYLREAIESALAQTWPAVEVIVVDDGSTDGGATIRIAESYGPRIRVIRNPHGGVSSALNAGIGAMTGDAFAWLSHDDIYLPEKVERQVAVLREHDGAAIVYSDYELVGPDRRRIKTKRLPELPPEGFRLWLMADSALHGCTLLVPRACLDGQRFDEQLSTTQDYDMWFRLAADHRFVRVPEVLLQYRIHRGQESWRNPRRNAEGNRLLLGFLDQMGPAAIRAATAEAPSLVYLGAAVRFKLRGFLEAAERAHALSRQETRTLGERLSPRRLALLLAYQVAHPSLRPMAWWKRLRLGGAPADPGRALGE